MAVFKITILGAGTFVPTKRRNPAGFLIETDGKKILLDCGFGTIRRLTDLGYKPAELDVVSISHFHADHFADAFPLIQSRYLYDIENTKKHKSFIYLGPKSLKSRFGLWRKIFWPEPGEKYPVKFKEGAGNIKIGRISIETFPIKHVPWFGAQGVILRFKGKKVVYTGDLGSGNEMKFLAKKAKDAELLIIEAGTKNPTQNHFTLEQANQLKAWAGAKKVLIVHVPPQREKEAELFCRRTKGFIFKNDKETINI